MASGNHPRTHRFKPPRRRPSPHVDDGLLFAKVEDGPSHKISLHTTQDDAAASPVEPMSVSDFLRQPSSPPEWSSTTSASLTDSEDFGSEAEDERSKVVAGRSGLCGQNQGQVKPTRRRETRSNVSASTQEARLDEFMRSSSRLYEQMYRRIEALEGVVETLLEGYREVLGRVTELERRTGGRGKELSEQLGSLHRAVRLGRMPCIDRVYEEGRPLDEALSKEDPQDADRRSRRRNRRS